MFFFIHPSEALRISLFFVCVCIDFLSRFSHIPQSQPSQLGLRAGFCMRVCVCVYDIVPCLYEHGYSCCSHNKIQTRIRGTHSHRKMLSASKIESNSSWLGHCYCFVSSFRWRMFFLFSLFCGRPSPSNITTKTIQFVPGVLDFGYITIQLIVPCSIHMSAIHSNVGFLDAVAHIESA